MKIYLAAKSVFDKYDIEIENVEKDYPEIQADSSLEIAKYTALEAAKDLNTPTVREDHSLFINVLGIPGPYTSYIEKRISVDKLALLIKRLGNNRGHFEVATVLAYPDKKTFEYVFKVPITFGEEPKGKKTKGWSGLIRLNNEKRAITEYPESERLHIWNKGYEAVARKLVAKSSLKHLL